MEGDKKIRKKEEEGFRETADSKREESREAEEKIPEEGDGKIKIKGTEEPDDDPVLSDSAEENSRCREKPSRQLKWLSVSLIVLVVFLFLVILGSFVPIEEGNTGSKESIQELDTGREREEETEISVIRLRDTEKAETGEDQALNAPGETKPDAGSDTAWQEIIFGVADISLMSSIRLSGLTNSVKEKTGFRESDFLYSVSSFLQENGLSGVTEVAFEEEIPCSAENAFAFKAALEGGDGRVLQVILYPDYPGYCLLTLQEAREDALEIMIPQASESENPVQEQNEIYAPVEAYPEEQVSSYDATSLSIKGIPETLSNYLENCLELQYTLYDYLYRYGRTDVTWAEVTGYEIDADARMAVITLRLSDAGNLTCTYNKNTNSYSYG